MGKQTELLTALNAAAASLQRAVHSEEDVYDVVEEQIAHLGLRGGLSLLDEESGDLVFRAVHFRDAQSVISRVQKRIGIAAKGYRVSPTKVRVYREVLETSRAVFVANTRATLVELLPTAARPLAKMILEAFAGHAGIYAPVKIGDQVCGVLNLVGAELRQEDMPTMEAFSNHIGIALHTARLFSSVRESEERLRALIANATDPIVGLDGEGRVVLWNPAAMRLFGYEETEVLGKELLRLIVPAEQEGSIRAVLGAPEATGRAVELVGVRKDASEIPIELSVAASGEAQATAIIRDLTARKRMEAEWLKIEKLESLGLMAGGIAHDFNNLLTAILAAISLARLRLGPDREEYTHLAIAEEACRRANGLTQQLLTFSQGGAPVKKPVSLEELINETVGFVLRGSSCRCEVSAAPDLHVVELDADQISRVLANVIVNAEHAMPQGGEIAIRVQNHTVAARDSLLLLSEGAYVRIEIVDRGVGMTPEETRKVFDPFFTTKIRGTGLGLTISHSIVKRHGGHMTIESAVGDGTTVCIYLPASPGAQIAADEADEVEPVAGEGRILLMDDEEPIRQVTSAILTRSGYEVRAVRDGAEAIDAYVQAMQSGRRFDAVILDLTVPGGMGGTVAIAKLREIDPDVIAIVSSGYSTDPVVGDFVRHGFKAALIKPYDHRQLLTTVGGATRPALRPVSG